MNDQTEDAVARLVRLAGARPRPDVELTARVRDAVRAEWQRTTQRRRFVRYGIGAALAATLAAVLFLRPQTRTIDVPLGTASSIDWNGATVRLEPGTLLTIESASVATLERGTMYFSSEGHAGITVKTPFGDVRDIGTKFEIRLSSAEMHIRVDEGAVEVRGTRADAGTQLIATRETVNIQIKLEGRTLGDVLDQAARAKGMRVQWETDRNVILHGRVTLTPEEAIVAATAASGVDYRIEGNTIIVSRRK